MSLIVKFYDVEHGCCTHIITPSGKHILVDIGSKTDKSIVRHIKGKYFPCRGTIDQLIITHPHEDHIWGIPDMYKLEMKPRVLFRPKNAYDISPTWSSTISKEIAEYANEMNSEYSSPVQIIEDPLQTQNNGGVDINIFSAPCWSEDKNDLNTFSSIITVEYLGFKFVLTGDNPASILKRMVERNADSLISRISKATILLAPHHGRSGEFCKEFFDVVNPLLSIISDKHVVHETQEQSSSQYHGRGCTWGGNQRYVFSTRNDGTITIKINPDKKWLINTSFEEY